MNIERSFVFAFKAPGSAKKLFLGGLFTLLFFTVFFAFVVVGYLMRIFCNTLEGRDARIPEWDDLVGLFNEGLQPLLIILIYNAPVVMLFVIEQLFHTVTGTNLGVVVVFGFLRLVISIIVSILLPLGLIRFVVKGTLRAAFDFGQIVDFIKTNSGNYFTAWGLSLVLAVASGIIGFIVFFIGVFFTSFISYVIMIHLYGQAYRASTPFSDDQEGKVRASMAIPPPLNR